MANDFPHAGSLVAEILSGAWRESAGPTNFSADQLSAVTPLLYSSGSAALAWWRMRHCVSSPSVSEGNLRQRPLLTRGLLTPAAELLHDAYRQMRLAALVHEREIKYVLSLLRAVDIEPVLVKGWAVARHYPDRALRPYGDIDLCVRPDQFAKAAAALKCLETIEGHYVDLHAGFDHIGVDTQWHGRLARGLPSPLGEGPGVTAMRREWDELFERSQLVRLSEPGAVATGWSFPVRVLGPEDHLRILCLHLLRSGAWRPLWLCDVALLVEQRGPDFDWHRCLGRDPLYADWVACTIGLAHQLLGAEVKDTPLAARAQNLPRWLVPAVLRQWGRGRTVGSEQWAVGSVSSPTVREGELRERPLLTSGLLTRNLRNLRTAFRDLYARWDNPVRATAAVHGRFNNWPRLPYRVAESIMRSPELPKHLTRMLRRRPAPKMSDRFTQRSDLRPLTSDL